ncbi:Transposable element Tc1 transposase [Anthophora retusa]
MVGDIVKIDSILRKEQYLNILIEHAVPTGSRLIGQNFIFMQDNDPKHTAKLKVREKCPTSQKDLWKCLQETWKEISTETMRKLVERLPRLVQAVISNRGGYVDESRI